MHGASSCVVYNHYGWLEQGFTCHSTQNNLSSVDNWNPAHRQLAACNRPVEPAAGQRRRWWHDCLYCRPTFIHSQSCLSTLHAPVLLTIALHLVICLHTLLVPSVLWRCWLGGRKGIWPVKNWAVGCWCGYLSGARCRLAYGPADSTATYCLLLQ